jgi:FAD/FMN-containing dehydrogenase
MALDRRTFLRGAGTAAMAVGLGTAAGCGKGAGRSAVSTTTTTRRATTTTTGGPPPWDALAAALTGPLVLPADGAYGVDKLLYNERFDAINPAAIAFCQSPTDVQHCVAFARAHGVQPAARSGGHSYAGYSLCSGLVIDVTAMNAVQPQTGSQPTAVVGAGTRLIDLYSALDGAGLMVPGGSCPTVGIAGLALGGGIGVLGRKYGLTTDNIVSADMVTADSRLVTCSAEENTDLYWALRGGGGGNFGVVTSFTFTAHPIPELALFTLEWPWDAAADVLGAWQQWVPLTPAELWTNCQLLSGGSAGGGTPTLRVTGVYAGPVADCSSAIAPLVSAVTAAPTDQFVGPEAYLPAMLVEAGCEGLSVAQCHLPSQNPAGTQERALFAAKSAFIAGSMAPAGDAGVVADVVSLSGDLPGLGGGFVFDSYGGVINEVPADATAFVHRDALASIEYSYSWSAATPASQVAQGSSWLDAAQETLAPYAVGAYQNYIDPTLADWPQAYYGSNLARLVKVKSATDPDDLFHFAQSIPTSL